MTRSDIGCPLTMPLFQWHNRDWMDGPSLSLGFITSFIFLRLVTIMLYIRKLLCLKEEVLSKHIIRKASPASTFLFFFGLQGQLSLLGIMSLDT